MPRKAANATPGADGGAAAPPAARAAKPVVRGRGKGKNAKGRVCKFADVSVEVFFEIAKQLQPLDLLHLARASKTFRGALMDRKARHVWTTTIQNAEGIPLPPVPVDMSEPAFIDLLLGRVCHGCFKKGVFSPFWEIRMRLCPACRNGLQIERARYIHVGDEPHPLRDHFPELAFDARTANVCALSLIPVVSKDFVERCNMQWGELPYLVADYEGLKQALSGAASAEERKTIVQERQAIMNVRLKQLCDCEQWTRDMRVVRSGKTRPQTIVAKMRKLGFGLHLDNMSSQDRKEFLDMPEVSQGGPLTAREWQDIKDKCIFHVEFAICLQKPEDQGDGIIGWDGTDLLDDNQ